MNQVRQIGMLSHQLHHSGHAPVQKGPLTTMQTMPNQTPASAKNKPKR
jgi:hypothetical protein